MGIRSCDDYDLFHEAQRALDQIKRIQKELHRRKRRLCIVEYVGKASVEHQLENVTLKLEVT